MIVNTIENTKNEEKKSLSEQIQIQSHTKCVFLLCGKHNFVPKGRRHNNEP